MTFPRPLVGLAAVAALAALAAPASASGPSDSVPDAVPPETSAPPESSVPPEATSPEIVIDGEVAVPGEHVTVNGSGFAAGAMTVLLDDAIEVATVTPDTDGTFELRVPVPGEVSGGDFHWLRFERADSMADVLAAPLTGPVADLIVQAARQATPVPESPNGRTITLLDTQAAPGGVIRFTGTGYLATDGHGGGQTVTVKLNDGDILGTAEADSNGNVTGQVTIPAFLPAGGTYWLRFLAGAGKPDDMPPSSIFEYFDLRASATTTTTTTAAQGATTTTSPPAGGTSTTTLPGGQSSGATTTTVRTGTTTTTVPGTLVNNGDEQTAALTTAALVGALGAGGLALGRRLRRSGTQS